MARKEKALKGNGRDGVNYREFLDELLAGAITAVALIDTTVPHGAPRNVAVQQFDQNGAPLPDATVSVQDRRLTRLRYDEP